MSKSRLPIPDLVKIDDPRNVPTYSIPEAAHYVRIPPETLRSWVIGRPYQTEAGKKWFEPLIKLPNRKIRLLSFINLAEAHVLSACRKKHKIPLPKIRAALEYVGQQFQSEHPLIDREFETNGISLFVTQLGTLIDASAQGQVVIRSLVESHLRRLQRENDAVVRLYPFTRPLDIESPKSVYIDPRMSFGRQVLASAHIPTRAFAERYRAGESIESLAKDYGCTHLEVEEALRCEMLLAA